MALPKPQPVHVLHVISKLQHGGIETWLMHIFRNSDPSLVRHEVLLSKPERGAHDLEAERLGVVIHRPARRLGRLAYARSLDRLLRNERFDVVHSHAYLFSGIMLAVAKWHGVPARIAHAHQAPIKQGQVTRSERFRYGLLRKGVDRFATHLVGISEDAIVEIAGADWRTDSRAQILIYGFDFSTFADSPRRAAEIRRGFGIAEDTSLVGHVGRFAWQKNHDLLIDSFAKLARERPDVRLMLVGEGELKTAIRSKAEQSGLGDRIIFAGTTTDMAGFMRAFDLFVLPSRHEGLGIVAVEAQAAGTPSLLSDNVPPEAIVLPELVAQAPASASAQIWAEAMHAALGLKSADRDECWKTVAASRYGISRCLSELMSIYNAAR